MLRQFTRAYSTKVLPKSSDVVVVGGGVIGLSTAYHLTQLGYKNVIVVERNDITSGTTWHTNGLVWRLRPSQTDVQLLSQTHHLLTKELIDKPGVETTGWINNGGLFLAHNKQRMQEYQRLNGLSHYYGIESHILDRNQTIDLLKPLINESTTDLVGGLYSPNDGFVDPHMYCSALIKGAQLQVFNNCRLIAINTSECTGADDRQTQIKSARLQYDNDTHEINTGIIVNCTGCWAPTVAKLAGIPHLPQETMEHSYVMTEAINGVIPGQTPNIRDHDLSIVFRVCGSSFGIGGYESNPQLISEKVDGLGPFTLFDLNWDKFGINMENAIKLMPVLNTTGIKSIICGPESFTPDHRPLLGEDMSVRGFYHCTGFNSFGINLSGGVGLQMAKWIACGAPDIDLSAYDIKRFNRHLINNRVWSQMRCTEAYARNYGIIYQRDQPLTARNETFRDVLYETLLSRGCVFGERHGIQSPDWFDLESTPLTKEQYIDLDNTYEWPEDNRLWKAVKHECRAAYERAVLFNLSSMAKFMLKGPNSLQVMDSLSSFDLKSMQDNSSALTYLLNRRGGIDADIVVHKVDDNQLYITCADLNTNQVLAKIKNLISDQMIKNLEVIDLSQRMGVLSISGPKSTEVLENCLNISLKNFEDRTHREIRINDIPLRLIRISMVSEDEWELHLNNNEDLKSMYSKLISSEMVTNAGLRTYESLKDERHYLSAGIDLRTEDILNNIGLGSKVKCSGFVGSEELKSRPNDKHFVCIEFPNKSPIVCGLEPIWDNTQVVGLVRKSFYSHSTQKMLAFGAIDNKYVENRGLPSEVKIEIFGQLFDAKVDRIIARI